jgi:DNA mismatch repair protein MutS2
MAGALGLDGEVIDRARTLLDEGQRALADTLERLSAERASLAETRRAVEARAAEAEARLRQLELDEQKLAREGRKRLDEALATHRARLHAREEEVKALVARLQAGGDLATANRGLQELRAMRAAVTMVEPPAAEAPPYRPHLGESVRVRSLDQVGVVRALGNRPEVEIGRMRMRVALTDLEPARGKAANAAKALDPDAGAPRVQVHVREAATPPTNGAAIRTSLNSCDVRGQRADEAIATVERFVDAASLSADRTVFVCHGHGTGALKNALRAWLPGFRAVKRWRPADADEGGDAWTVLELRT